MTALTVEPGTPLPLGASEASDGFNIAVVSRHATRVSVLLFDPAGALLQIIALDPARHRTGDVWHVRIAGVTDGYSYALRAEGRWAPEEGHRFDPRRLLLDPYAVAVVGAPRPDEARALLTTHRFDWGGDTMPRHPWRETLIYETHVRGFTIHLSSGVAHGGCFIGVTEMIPYLQALGITAVELMPVQEAPEWVILPEAPDRPVRDYWGYDPIAFFAPRSSYATAPGSATLTEFKAMVQALHKAGIEVILDIVFNHTAEGGADGPTFSFRGLDNSIYYMLGAMGSFSDYTGCGNTLNCNHPIVRSMLVDCLRYWVMEMHVDGFRFDLAAVLGRGEDGALLANPPLLEQIAEDPVLRGTKLIAESWDAAGAFQLGEMPGDRWAEWNSRFRDDVRRFWQGAPGAAGAFATRLCGSEDLFGGDAKGPLGSINFITCHDGPTLNDWASDDLSHNQTQLAPDASLSPISGADTGASAPPGDPSLEAMRARQCRNMLATLLLARGIPMLLGGDEFLRTQRGNTNPWDQDNEISWYDWTNATKHADLVRFVRRLVAFRRAHPVLSADRFYTARDITWIGPHGGAVDWHGPDNQLGCIIHEDAAAPAALCLLFNGSPNRPAQFDLPLPPAGEWRLAIDTSAASPHDVADTSTEPLTSRSQILPPRSLFVLVSR
ncbi:glycogen debranching protein [Roseomonas marmotae]|uniref:Glycogen-debranching protein n=1 Tax=Roseomonas marmotae TaxID=2768161 RepID=A0ABS3KI74_9PROT|nr:isoamylase [Roseomonas marmotae]MBO1077145.1 glycogen-debranching protein [Roseomonas marmotae]QTI81825.1 glycogen-debranching protein [Roseomonas marmotae]